MSPFKAILVGFSLALASAAPAPQTFLVSSPSVTRAATSSFQGQAGLSTVTSHAKTVSNEHSTVHKHDSRVINPSVVVRRRRPIGTRITDHTSHNLVAQPLVGRTTLVSANSPILAGRTALVNTVATPTITNIAAAPKTIFQTANGRFFAELDASQQGQNLFQTADGRLFAVASSGLNVQVQENADDSSVIENDSSAVFIADDDDEFIIEEADSLDIADAVRSLVEEEEQQEVEDGAIQRAANLLRIRLNTNNNVVVRNNALNNVVVRNNAALNNVVVRNNALNNVAVVSAPLTANNARFIGAGSLVRQVPAATTINTIPDVSTTHFVPATAAAQRTVIAANPLRFSPASSVSTGFVTLRGSNVQYALGK